ncbi:MULTISPECIES: hypothetical protein [Deinococcus]|uniref:Uncharacterized protein n=1 Tax=Deinococcus rufus TaxID=2136097 RepID=A0ABV7ZD51_9DEIO|nr:hypothetical protein [Deinococcus sp. AB2017081]WQE94265.1 hypothetical protein U2P90_12700 [Deinococcus sp. AB2017081]
MENKSDRPTAIRRPAAGMTVLLAAILAFYTTQIDSVWRYPLGIVAIILVVVAIRNLRRGGQ